VLFAAFSWHPLHVAFFVQRRAWRALVPQALEVGVQFRVGRVLVEFLWDLLTGQEPVGGLVGGEGVKMWRRMFS